MQEHWTRWEPISNLSKKYYIESISDSMEGFKVLLFEAENPEKKVLVSFSDSVEAFRSTNESYTFLTIDSLAEKYGSKFFSEWTFFKIENSKYLQWISEQSYGISESYNLIHFCLVATDSIVDIIDTGEPKVTLLEEPKL